MTEEEKIKLRKIKSKEYYLKNRENILNKRKLYRENNSSKIKEYNDNNKEKNKTRKKNWYITNKEHVKKYGAIYRKNNKININNYKKIYYNNNKSNIRSYFKYLRNNNPIIKLTDNIRRNIRYGFTNNGFIKNNKTQDILGCSFDEFKIYLESLWEPWMNWGNYGNPKDGIIEPNKTWDIDHIIPISTAITEDDIIRLNHYTNLQPLCTKINRHIKRNSSKY
jgi:hypothetical protein